LEETQPLDTEVVACCGEGCGGGDDDDGEEENEEEERRGVGGVADYVLGWQGDEARTRGGTRTAMQPQQQHKQTKKRTRRGRDFKGKR
jgi:hypothetical protein